MEELTVRAANDLLMGTVSEGGAPELDDAPGKGIASDPGGASGEGAVPGRADAPDPAGAPERTGASAEERTYAGETVGLGIDIVEIERMADTLRRSPAFAERVFSQAERDYCNAKANPATHYALRFAAKEAVVKALGTGFADGVWVHDIEVRRTKAGKPMAHLSGRALEVAREQGVRDLSLSLSYTHTEAVACAMAITEAAMRESEKRKDPMEELERQFKETRSILDDL